MDTQTTKLKIRLIQPTEDFADDAFNKVIKDIDDKVVGIDHISSGAHWVVWNKNTDYAVGDIVRTPYLKSNQYMECTVAGTSSTTVPTNNVQGSNVTDNSVTWVIKAIGSTSDSTVSFWKSGTQYYKGSLVIYNNKLYRSYFAHIASTFNNDKINWYEVQSTINDWASNMYYAVGDTVVFEGNVYRCNTENTDSTFLVANWDLLNSYGIVKNWTPSTRFFINQLVSYGGVIYKATSTFTSGTSFSDSSLELVHSSILDWSPSVYYPVGVLVQHDNIIYKCVTSNTSSTSFTSDYSNWEIFHTPNAFVRNWQANVEYKTNQLVVVNNNLYRRTSDGYDTSWTDGAWELVTKFILDWSANTVYEYGQYVNYKDKLYKCIAYNNDASWTPANWKRMGGSLENWTTSTAYSIDDIVIYNDRIYQCTTAHNSTTFLADKNYWKEISSFVVNINDWKPTTDYVIGDLVAYKAQIYRCKTAHTSVLDFETDEAKWEILSPTINEITDWSQNKAYTVDNLVIYDNKLYKCLVAHTSGIQFDVDRTNWQEISSYGINDWKVTTTYVVNDLVIHNNKIYRCITQHRSTDFGSDIAYWIEISPMGNINWKSNEYYAVNSIVIYDNRLYNCNTAHKSSSDFFNDVKNWDLVTNIQPWLLGKNYKQGIIVINDNVLYRCKVDHQSTIFSTDEDNGYWEKITSSGGAVDWSATTKYDLHQLVMYSGVLYRANKKHTSDSSFDLDKDKWDIVYANVVDYKNGELYKKDSLVVYNRNFYRCLKDNTSSSDDIVMKTVAFNNTTGLLGITDSTVLPKDEIIDLGSKKHIIHFKAEQDGHGMGMTKLVFSYSNDNVSYTDFYTYRKLGVMPGEIIDFECDIECKYIKITVEDMYVATSSSAVGLKNTTIEESLDTWELLHNITVNILDFKPSTHYNKNDIVVYDNTIYRSLNDHDSASNFDSDSSNWESINKMIVEDWKPDTYYNKNQLIIYGYKLFRCNKNHTSTNDFSSDKLIYWNSLNDDVTIKEWKSGLAYEYGNTVIVTNISGIVEWIPNKVYSVGDKVIYNEYLYTASIANSDAVFDEVKWTFVEPVYNRLYRCIKDNKDVAFNSYKWQLINGDSKATVNDVLALLA